MNTKLREPWREKRISLMVEYDEAGIHRAAYPIDRNGPGVGVPTKPVACFKNGKARLVP